MTIAPCRAMQLWPDNRLEVSGYPVEMACLRSWAHESRASEAAFREIDASDLGTHSFLSAWPFNGWSSRYTDNGFRNRSLASSSRYKVIKHLPKLERSPTLAILGSEGLGFLGRRNRHLALALRENGDSNLKAGATQAGHQLWKEGLIWASSRR
ncbi:hypothetical protein BDV06DRAFT_194065 [Aspergillus oleicola]